MRTIFEPAKLGNLEIKNRLVRSATQEIGAMHNGQITSRLGDIYADLARGGVGLIITGMMGVAPNSCASPGMAKIYSDTFAEEFLAVAERVHAQGGKLVVQLGHCGARAAEIDDGDSALAPSDIPNKNPPVRAMTVEEIENLVKAYGAAALSCKDAGADGVQIHAAHGYLISEFLSPLFNHRTDAYGGSAAGRARLLFEVYDEIRRQVGSDYPILVKLNYTDLTPGGVTEEEVLANCKELSRRGIDAIEVSCGAALDRITNSTRGAAQEEAFNSEFAIRLSFEIDSAVISVGGYRSPEKIEQVLNESRIAAISMCRALIREPNLPERWRSGDRTKAECIACSRCFNSSSHGCWILQNAIEK